MEEKKGTTFTVDQIESVEDFVPGRPIEILEGEDSTSFGQGVKSKMICEVDLDILNKK
jgi:hypothetical protein